MCSTRADTAKTAAITPRGADYRTVGAAICYVVWFNWPRLRGIEQRIDAQEVRQ